MSEGFSRTLQTAADADGIERLLLRAADRLKGGLHADRPRLIALAERYRDYAAALRASVADDEPAPASEQRALL